MFSRRSHLAAGLLVVTSALTGVGAHPVYADAIAASCHSTTATLITIDRVHDNATTLTGQFACSSPGNPAISSATLTGSGTAIYLGGITATVTQDTLTFNTGATTTLTEGRTILGTTTVTETGTGATLGGLLHPAVETETGTGTIQFGGQANILVNLITNRVFERV
ncbi:hypothetical protein [Streptomyces vinaceus]|uniref:hypothetical protein n=1 Tax=Streptomyces vinaceus TaxID=1960 RepID=UPI0036A4E1E6